MTYEWDTAKAERNLAKHGVDFRDAVAVFADPALVTAEDTRSSYGEPRFIALGRIGGRVFVVVYTPRGAARRIISARKANDREQEFYRAV